MGGGRVKSDWKIALWIIALNYEFGDILTVCTVPGSGSTDLNSVGSG